MARILIIGGHGKVALLAAAQLVARGDEVTGVIRNPAHADDLKAIGATALLADVETLDTTALTELVDGFDAIVWSAGAGGGSPARTYAVDRDAAIRSIDAAASAGVARYIMVSWLGSRPDHGVPREDSFYAYADAKLAADERLRSSALDWTILAPGTLTSDAPTGRIELEPTGRGAVSRADVAAVMIAALDDEITVGRTVRFGGGAVPLRDAFGALSDG